MGDKLKLICFLGFAFYQAWDLPSGCVWNEAVLIFMLLFGINCIYSSDFACHVWWKSEKVFHNTTSFDRLASLSLHMQNGKWNLKVITF